MTDGGGDGFDDEDEDGISVSPRFILVEVTGLSVSPSLYV